MVWVDGWGRCIACAAPMYAGSHEGGWFPAGRGPQAAQQRVQAQGECQGLLRPIRGGNAADADGGASTSSHGRSRGLGLLRRGLAGYGLGEQRGHLLGECMSCIAPTSCFTNTAERNILINAISCLSDGPTCPGRAARAEPRRASRLARPIDIRFGEESEVDGEALIDSSLTRAPPSHRRSAAAGAAPAHAQPASPTPSGPGTPAWDDGAPARGPATARPWPCATTTTQCRACHCASTCRCRKARCARYSGWVLGEAACLAYLSHLCVPCWLPVRTCRLGTRTRMLANEIITRRLSAEGAPGEPVQDANPESVA